MTHNVGALWRYSVFGQRGTAAKLIIKSSLFVLLLDVIRLPKLKLNSEQKAENIPIQCYVSFFLF
jgi:hypothetical protein